MTQPPWWFLYLLFFDRCGFYFFPSRLFIHLKIHICCTYVRVLFLLPLDFLAFATVWLCYYSSWCCFSKFYRTLWAQITLEAFPYLIIYTFIYEVQCFNIATQCYAPFNVIIKSHLSLITTMCYSEGMM